MNSRVVCCLESCLGKKRSHPRCETICETKNPGFQEAAVQQMAEVLSPFLLDIMVFCCLRFPLLPLRKLTDWLENPLFGRCIFYQNMVIFHWHVSFRGVLFFPECFFWMKALGESCCDGFLVQWSMLCYPCLMDQNSGQSPGSPRLLKL